MNLEPSNPMNRAMMSVLIFEVIIFGLAIPGMLLVDDVPTALAVSVASVGAVMAIAASGGLKKRWGYPLGWLTQLLGVAMGLLTPMMFAVGGLFALIWIGSFVLGRRIEAHPQT